MKTFVVTLLFVLSTMLGFSQVTKYGIRGGTTISNMDYKDMPINENPHRNGFLFGIFIEYGITENFSIQPELQFSGEGSNKEDFRNDYINLPVLLEYRLLDFISLGLGPQAGLKVHKKNDGFKNFVFSGVGLIEFHLTEEWSVDARYQYGFSNVFDDELAVEAKNNVIQIGLNYKL